MALLIPPKYCYQRGLYRSHLGSLELANPKSSKSVRPLGAPKQFGQEKPSQ